MNATTPVVLLPAPSLLLGTDDLRLLYIHILKMDSYSDLIQYMVAILITLNMSRLLRRPKTTVATLQDFCGSEPPESQLKMDGLAVLFLPRAHDLLAIA